MKTYKIFDKATLKLANKIAIRRGYNRAIVEEHIDAQPENSFWAVTFQMLHEHAAGKAVDPHVRCMIRQLFVDNPPTLFIDTDMAIFDDLREISVEEKPAAEPVA